MDSRVYTVTELNEYIKRLLDGSPGLSGIYVSGEISNFTNHYKTGHFYMTVKDSGSLIKAVMFRGDASKLVFMPENGMKIIAHGRVAAFVRDGQYQLYIDSMEPDGVGALYVAYEQLKKRLGAEGLFDESKKRPLPKIPLHVGVITSPTGAAVRDIINICGRRFPTAEVVLYPALVQGDGAVAQLMRGLDYFERTRRADVVIIGRGGGSIEDLWAFNDENLARKISSMSIPVISAVGHETDFTICDFVADRRAPTPSAAAELAVPDTVELKRKINNITARMQLLLSSSIDLKRSSLRRLSSSRALSSPDAFITDKRTAVFNCARLLDSEIKHILTQKRADFTRQASLLDAVSPLKVITRGYCAVYDSKGTLVKSVDSLSPGDDFSFTAADGTVDGTVKTITHKKL